MIIIYPLCGWGLSLDSIIYLSFDELYNPSAKTDLVEGAKRLDRLQVDWQLRALHEEEETGHHLGLAD